MTQTIRIGLHAHNASLLGLSKTGFLRNNLAGQDVKVDWIRLPGAGGPRAIDYIGANQLDLSGTGATPPITGQANGVDLVYVATSRPRPEGGIAVRADSPYRSLIDLRGKKIAVSVGSWLQQLLSVALDRGGLKWHDVIPLDLPDPIARKALIEGNIDAWSSQHADADASGELRFLEKTEKLVSNPSVFFARRGFAEQHPDLLGILLRSLDDVDQWIKANPAEAAPILTDAASLTSEPRPWTLATLQKRPWGLIEVSEPFLNEQQETADLYFRTGLLPRKIDVRQAVLKEPVAVGKAA